MLARLLLSALTAPAFIEALGRMIGAIVGQKNAEQLAAIRRELSAQLDGQTAVIRAELQTLERRVERNERAIKRLESEAFGELGPLSSTPPQLAKDDDR